MSENDDTGAPEGADARPLRRRPVRRSRELVPEAAAAREARLTRPSGEGHHPDMAELALEEPRAQDVDPKAFKRAERLVAALFTLSAIGSLWFLVAFGFGTLHTPDYGQALNFQLAAGLTLAMAGVGAAMVVWQKKLLPHPKFVGEREDLHSDEEEELETERLFMKGVDELGIGRFKIIRRSLLAALSLLPLPFVFALRDLGPLPRETLRHTSWTKGVRLVNLDTNAPVKLGDLAVGGIMTVMPEGYGDVNVGENVLTPTMLIRLPPGVNVPLPGREGWAPYDHVAYSKICTHAGCPIGLYEHQTHHLLCPCHQSTFDVPHHCHVIFGPAARPLPQLPIYVDNEGYLRAQSDYHEPTGPSFWERGATPGNGRGKAAP